jgi:hypothetical protein
LYRKRRLHAVVDMEAAGTGVDTAAGITAAADTSVVVDIMGAVTTRVATGAAAIPAARITPAAERTGGRRVIPPIVAAGADRIRKTFPKGTSATLAGMDRRPLEMRAR